ncbi:MAG: hypothetical protein IPK02_09375 [Candidatus Accumulibacter sp.]|jgi:hypothetical protein|uniref:Enoyl-CoA hydratase n=1 Tax=Candidatus Accumulibacter affinis TaxID=2954384 RepID=A0A935TD11_9PROT|nr:hypothetical protein [Candidatus Accumulibacter affinis]
MMSDDVGEGIDAFLQKRKPEYEGGDKTTDRGQAIPGGRVRIVTRSLSQPFQMSRRPVQLSG